MEEPPLLPPDPLFEPLPLPEPEFPFEFDPPDDVELFELEVVVEEGLPPQLRVPRPRKVSKSRQAQTCFFTETIPRCSRIEVATWNLCSDILACRSDFRYIPEVHGPGKIVS